MSALDKLDYFLHGGDYNPDQWLNRPDILREDIAFMKEVRVNVVTLCVFSWSSLEPQEGVYTFSWLDEIMDRLWDEGIHVFLSTPSGGKPPWLILKYPDIMRVNQNRVRLLYGDRENHCNSHPLYRQKVREIDEQLAQRYAKHPALLLWHISNEFYGVCHCELCQENFRMWLRRKYGSLEALNEQYWTGFWSHRYTDWEEIQSPAPHGEASSHGLSLDYSRFYSDMTIDFMKMEIDTVKKYNPDIPATTNMFHFDAGIDYAKMAEHIEIASWDSYPRWHCGENKRSEWNEAVKAAFTFDYCRCLKDKPFLLMESTPSNVNHAPVCKLKRPGMHLLSAMQAVAFGADSVQYFQWRKGRGAYEQFHGAVVSHGGQNTTRVFRDVCEVGGKLQGLRDVKGTKPLSNVAVIYDNDNMRILKEQKSLKKDKKDFEAVVREHFEALLKNYVSVDIITRDADFSRYKLIVAPVQYLYGADTRAKIERFVRNGGHFVTTFYSGIVNENDLAFEGLPPHGLQEVFGLSAEETDAICDDEWNEVEYRGKTYKAVDYCDILRDVTAEPLAAYRFDFYAGLPAVTRNFCGKGVAYYLAFRSQDDFLRVFYADVLKAANVQKILDADFTQDILLAQRDKYTFAMNFSDETRVLTCGEEHITLEAYETRILVKE